MEEKKALSAAIENNDMETITTTVKPVENISEEEVQVLPKPETEEPIKVNSFRNTIYPEAHSYPHGSIQVSDITNMLPALENIKNSGKADKEIVSYCEKLIKLIEKYKNEMEKINEFGNRPYTSTSYELRNLIGRGIVLCHNRAAKLVNQKLHEDSYP